MDNKQNACEIITTIIAVLTFADLQSVKFKKCKNCKYKKNYNKHKHRKK